MKKRVKYIYLGTTLVLLIVWIIIMPRIEGDISAIGETPAKLKEIFSIGIPFKGINISTVVNTWVIMVILITGAWIVRKRLRKIPEGFQSIMETLVKALDDICCDTLGREMGRKYLSYIGTIFIFVLVSNWIGVIPKPFKLVYVILNWLGVSKIKWLLKIPIFEEPTRDLNTTIGLGIICFFVAHISGIRYRGWKKYLKDYIEPGGVIGVCMLPLNIVGEIAKVGSHSIRLFGNIMGGSVLILVLLTLSKQFIGVYLIFQPFFGIFVGLVQAFVFAMLALTYIAVKVS